MVTRILVEPSKDEAIKNIIPTSQNVCPGPVDKVARGTAKKIYLSGKKSNKSANDIIDEISNKLKDLDKMNDEIENLLKGLVG